MDAGRPRVVAGYVLEAELGRGGMGVVWRARGPDGRPAALKIVLAGDPDALLRAAREQRLQGALGKAEGFVPLLDAGVEATRPWLALELLEGGTLRERLKRGPLPQEDALALAQALARAMATAHARGIVHRDLKPENILFDREGRPFISDLGLAKHYRRDLPGASASRAMTSEGTGIGTPGYFPLEQAMDATRAGPAADVFALGAILHEALTGQRAFPASSLAHAVALLDQGAVPTLASRGVTAPPWLEAVVAQALARDPAARFPDAGALAAALERGAGRRRRRRGGRAGPALAVGLAVAAAGLLVVGVLAWRLRPPPDVRVAPAPTITEPAAPPATSEASRPAGPATLAVRRVIGDRLRRHADELSAVAFTPDGRQVVSGGRDGVVRWWDAAGGGVDGPAVATAHEVWDVALLPDGRALAGGPLGLSIVDPAARSVTATLGLDPEQAEGVACTAVELLPDGRVATAHTDGALRLWSLEGGLASRRQLELGALWDLALDAPRNRLLVVANDDGGGLPVSGRGGVVWLDLSSGETTPAYDSKLYNIEGARFWGGLALEEGGAVLCGTTGAKGLVLVLDARGGMSVQTTSARVNRLVQRGRTLFRVAFDGTVVAQQQDGKGTTELGKHPRPAVVVALDPAGRRLATGGLDGTVRLWDLARGPKGEVTGATELAPPGGGSLRCVAADGPGVAVAIGSDGVLRRLELATGRELERRSEPLGGGAWSLGYVPALGTVGVAATTAGGKAVLCLHDGRQSVAVDGLASLQVAAARDDSVAAVTVEGQVVFYRDRQAQASSYLVPGVASALTWAGPDRVVVATREGTIHAADRGAGGLQLAEIEGPVAALAAAPDGRWLVVASEAGQLGWLVRGEPHGSFAFGELAPRLLAPSPDGRWLAAAPLARRGLLDGVTAELPGQRRASSCTVYLFDADDAAPGRVAGALTVPLAEDVPTALAWADARTLLVGTGRGAVLVVDVPEGP